MAKIDLSSISKRVNPNTDAEAEAKREELRSLYNEISELTKRNSEVLDGLDLKDPIYTLIFDDMIMMTRLMLKLKL